MMKKLKSVIPKFLRRQKNQLEIEKILLNQGKILTELFRDKNAQRLSDYEWRVFSQWGEDGIIQFLISEIAIANKTFIEFGIEDYTESNSRYLLMNSDWQGFVIDCCKRNISRLQSSNYYWKYDLTAETAFVDTGNINEILQKSQFDRDLGILSIDIDGNDYHILKNIDCFDPRIIICEFNPLFGVHRAITVPYDPDFDRTEKHHSNLYFGASVKALTVLLSARGYTLVGTGMLGGNAYFVKSSLLTDRLREFSKDPFCFNGHFRESRNERGKLNYLSAKQRFEKIKGLKVLNVETGDIEEL